MPRSALAAFAALLCLPGAAHAATPRPSSILEEHHHHTGGHDWHLQVEVNKTSTRLASVVGYSQECGETGFVQAIRLGEGGSFDLDVPLQDKKGRFTVHGTFVDPDHATGTWQITRGACSFGGPFDAQSEKAHAPGEEQHIILGNPYEYAPRTILGTSTGARHLRALQYLSRRNASRFDTVAKARAQGYVVSTETGCPGLHHARKHGTTMWGRVLDSTAPQSLVFWCDSQEHYTLAGFMYRASGAKRPSTFGDMIQWHRHATTKTATWMAHIWLVTDPLSAFATCAPFRAFTADRTLRYEPYVVDAPPDKPCSDSTPAAPAAQ